MRARHARLVDLVGDLGDDDLLALAAPLDLLDVHARAHDDGAAPGAVRLLDAGAPVDEARGREVGAGDEADQVVDGRRRGCGSGAIVASMISPRLCGGMFVAMPTAMPPEPLTRRFGTRAGRTVGSCGGRRSSATKSTHSLSMSVRSSTRDAREARLGVPVGRRRIAVDRAEVALAVDERVAHREVLREADHRVVDGCVAVRVVLAEHVADDASRSCWYAARGAEPLLVGSSRGCAGGPA